MIVQSEADSAVPPAWFTEALAAPVTEGTATRDGVRIAYRMWGGPSARGIVLVHGGGAHSRWWDHIAPMLAVGRRADRAAGRDRAQHGRHRHPAGGGAVRAGHRGRGGHRRPAA